MKSETIALFIIELMIIISYAFAATHNFKEWIAMVCLFLLITIVIYGTYTAILGVIKDIRNED